MSREIERNKSYLSSDLTTIMMTRENYEILINRLSRYEKALSEIANEGCDIGAKIAQDALDP